MSLTAFAGLVYSEQLAEEAYYLPYKLQEFICAVTDVLAVCSFCSRDINAAQITEAVAVRIGMSALYSILCIAVAAYRTGIGHCAFCLTVTVGYGADGVAMRRCICQIRSEINTANTAYLESIAALRTGCRNL